MNVYRLTITGMISCEVKNKDKIHGSIGVKVRKRSEFFSFKVVRSMLPVISRILAKTLEIGCKTYKLEGEIE